VTEDRWSGGDDYERYIGRWSRPVGAIFVDWLGVPAGARWLDVGCGTGALSGTILARATPSAVTGIDPSASFVEHASRTVTDHRASFRVARAEEIPLETASLDVAVAGLVLNFVGDLPAALAEMRRVVVPGGMIAGYVWDYGDGMELLRHFFDAAVAVDPAAAAEDEAVRFPICREGALGDLFVTAGLREVDVRPIEVPTVFAGFDDYWSPFLSGIAAAPRYAMSLGGETRVALRERLRSTLPTEADGSIHLAARAWAVRARTS
jgi:SAM-dependent methyltransferase